MSYWFKLIALSLLISTVITVAAVAVLWRLANYGRLSWRPSFFNANSYVAHWHFSDMANLAGDVRF